MEEIEVGNEEIEVGDEETIDKEKAYNTVAIAYYEMQQLKDIKEDLLSMEQEYKAKVKIKTFHTDFISSYPHLYSIKKTFNINPKLLIQIIDGLIENKKEYLDKAIDLTVCLEKNEVIEK